MTTNRKTRKKNSKKTKWNKNSTLINTLVISAVIYFFGFSLIVLFSVEFAVCPPTFMIGSSGSCSDPLDDIALILGILVAYVVPIVIIAIIAKNVLKKEKGQNHTKKKRPPEYEDDMI